MYFLLNEKLFFFFFFCEWEKLSDKNFIFHLLCIVYTASSITFAKYEKKDEKSWVNCINFAFAFPHKYNKERITNNKKK